MGVLWVWRAPGHRAAQKGTWGGTRLTGVGSMGSDGGGEIPALKRRASSADSAGMPSPNKSMQTPVQTPNKTATRTQRLEFGSVGLRRLSDDSEDSKGADESAGLSVTPSRRKRRENLFLTSDANIADHAGPIMPPTPHALQEGKEADQLPADLSRSALSHCGRPPSEEGATEYTDSVGDLEETEVHVCYSPHVAMLDLGLAQASEVRCAARKKFIQVCQHNSEVALQAGRTDVAQAWIVAAYADIRAVDGAMWAMQPMGRALLCTLVAHHAQHDDVQTVASLVAVFVSAFGSSTLLSSAWAETEPPSPQKTREADESRYTGVMQESGIRQGAADSVSSFGSLRETKVHAEGWGGGGNERLGYNYEENDETESWLESRGWAGGGRGAGRGEGGKGSRWSRLRQEVRGGGFRQGFSRGSRARSELEMVVRALLGDQMLPQASSGKAGGMVSAVAWVSWAVTYYIDVLFSYKVLDLVAQLRGIFPQPTSAPESPPRRGLQSPSRGANATQGSYRVSVKRFKADAAGQLLGVGGDGLEERQLRCSVCRLPVLGLATSCAKCGHGGMCARAIFVSCT